MTGTIAKRTPILIFCFLTFALWASHEKAVELNKLGYKAYQDKDYPQALEYFAAAIREDETYLYPHHNYTCVLALTYREGDTRTLRTIISHLKKTIELDRTRAWTRSTGNRSSSSMAGASRAHSPIHA